MWSSRLFYLIGCWVLILSAFQAVPFIAAAAFRETAAASGFLSAMMICLLVGGALFLGFRSSLPIKVRRLTILLPLVGACSLALTAGLPFFFIYPDLGFIPAFYEGMSLITTTGTSAYEGAFEDYLSIRLWRALASWVGGFIAICTSLSILTALNSGGLQLHRSPLPYGDSTVGYPRLKSVAQTIAPIYLLATLVCCGLLMLAGNPFLHAVMLAMATVATAGIDPVGGHVVTGTGTQLVVAIFLLIGMLNWDVLYARVRGMTAKHPQGAETRSLLIVLGVGVLMLVVLAFPFGTKGLWHAVFSAISSLSTSGFQPDNFVLSHDGAVTGGIIFALLACLGGATAGTTGGLKQLRLHIVYFLGRAEIDRLAHPHGVKGLKFQNFSIERGDIEAVWLLIGGFVLTLIAGCLALAVMGIDFQSALAMALSALTLSGPLVNMIDPYFSGFSGLTEPDYLFLTVLMLIGRVEASLFLALLARSFWRG
jgi:Trk-type K+ transport system membrane component